MAVMTYIDAINAALSEEMERDPNVFIIGEDVGKMGAPSKPPRGYSKNSAVSALLTRPLQKAPLSALRSARPWRA